MSKTLKRALCIFFLLILCAGLGILLYQCHLRTVDNQDSEKVIIEEAEILDISFQDTDTQVILTVSMNGKKSKIYLQKDTIIQNKTGQKRDFMNLEIGQFIKAEVNSTVLYDSPMVQVDSETSYESLDIFYRCYKVIILK